MIARADLPIVVEPVGTVRGIELRDPARPEVDTRFSHVARAALPVAGEMPASR